MPKRGREYTAHGGTTFVWDPDNPEGELEVFLPPNKVTASIVGERCVAMIPGADLDEFLAHTLGQIVDDTCTAFRLPSVRATGGVV